MFAFEVKFYPPDPAILQEDITRFVSLTDQLSVNNNNNNYTPCVNF